MRPSEAEHIWAVLSDGSVFPFSRSCGVETKVVSISQYVPLLIWVSKLTQNILDIWNLHMHVRISYYKWSIYYNNNVQHCKKKHKLNGNLTLLAQNKKKLETQQKTRKRERDLAKHKIGRIWIEMAHYSVLKLWT